MASDLSENPKQGIALGNETYKIRLKITSKGKGKSVGARIISLLETNIIAITEQISEEEITVNLISIYDKAELEDITDKELRVLIKNFREKSPQ